METNLDYVGSGQIMFFSSDEKRWINHIRKLQASNPDDVRILAEPEENDGCIYCTLPRGWLKVSPPRTPHKNMTEEERRQIGKMLTAAKTKRTEQK